MRCTEQPYRRLSFTYSDLYVITFQVTNKFTDFSKYHFEFVCDAVILLGDHGYGQRGKFRIYQLETCTCAVGSRDHGGRTERR